MKKFVLFLSVAVIFAIGCEKENSTEPENNPTPDDGKLFVDQQIIIANVYPSLNIFAIDMDGDGDLDVLDKLSDSDGNERIAWYPNDGAGHFGNEQVVNGLTNGDRINMDIADLDGDADQDMLLYEYETDTLAWYENNGNGHFNSRKVIDVFLSGSAYPYAADMDNDGDNDILLSYFTSRFDYIAWCKNDGHGNFATRDNFAAAEILEIHRVSYGDPDGDGDLDVMATFGSDDGLFWYVNDGTGQFSDRQVLVNTNDDISNIVLADLNGDGELDLLTRAGSYAEGQIMLYMNNGNAQFGEGVCISAEENVKSFDTADLDDDGDVDVVFCARQDDKIAWYKNNGKGSFTEQEVITNKADRIYLAKAVDLDNDMDLDLLTVFDNKIAWYKNKY